MENDKQENKYLILETIATGGMATIYKGMQISLNREVVIKKLHPHLSEDANFVKRFRREAALLGKLHHENIVGIFDFYEKDGEKFIVLEYIKGKSLKQIIKEKGHIPVKFSIYILKEVLKGLSYVHKNEILHRDLKPDNIMISEEGIVKITDFGLAFGRESVNVTNPGTYVGTPAYFPPEQLTGQQLTVASDIFSLGITLAEMLTGKNPFEGKNQFETINTILYFKSLNIDFDANHIPQVISDILKSMMSRDISKRPKNGDELLKAVSNIENSETKESLREFIYNISSTEQEEPIRIKIKKESRYQNVFLLIALFALFIALIIFQINVFNRRGDEVRTVYVPAENEKKPFLFINSDPKGVQVTINDSIIVATPQIISLEKGIFKISLFGDEYMKIDTTINLEKNDTIILKPIKRIIVEEFGGLALNVSPWADLYIDGTIIDRTPIEKNIKLKTGRHQIMLKHPNRKVFQKDIEIKKDEIYKLNIELEKAYGYLKIVVRPWADLYIDDNPAGTTPLSDSIKLLTGPHKIVLSNPNYPRIEEDININEEEVLRKVYSF